MEMNNDTMHHTDDENIQMHHQDLETDKTTDKE